MGVLDGLIGDLDEARDKMREFFGEMEDRISGLEQPREIPILLVPSVPANNPARNLVDGAGVATSSALISDGPGGGGGRGILYDGQGNAVSVFNTEGAGVGRGGNGEIPFQRGPLSIRPQPILGGGPSASVSGSRYIETGGASTGSGSSGEVAAVMAAQVAVLGEILRVLQSAGEARSLLTSIAVRNEEGI